MALRFVGNIRIGDHFFSRVLLGHSGRCPLGALYALLPWHREFQDCNETSTAESFCWSTDCYVLHYCNSTVEVFVNIIISSFLWVTITQLPTQSWGNPLEHSNYLVFFLSPPLIALSIPIWSSSSFLKAIRITLSSLIFLARLKSLHSLLQFKTTMPYLFVY